jgi:trans-aconitate methyltransferase
MTGAHRSSVLPIYHNHPRQLADELTGFEAHLFEIHSAALALLPRRRYRSGLEIGCAVGALTERLSQRCAALLAIDRCEAAIAAAQQRCAHLPQTQFQQMRVPEEYPTALFDLTIVSEVGRHWSCDDLRIAQRRIVAHLEATGHLLLIHRTGSHAQRTLDADAVHDAFLEQLQSPLRHVNALHEPSFRIDLFERV